MATFSITDRGAEQGALRIELDANGDPRGVTVEIVFADGTSKYVPLSRAEAAAALTAGERAAVRTAMPKFYAAAVVKAGGV